MLNTDVLNDYKNDWIKRCTSIKDLDSFSFADFRISWLANENNVAFSAMARIFEYLLPKPVRTNDNINDDDLLLVWDLSDFPLSEDQRKKIASCNNKALIVYDNDGFSFDEYSSDNITALYCGSIYGAGYNDIMPDKNSCTNVLDFLAAQLYMLCNQDLIEDNVYYAGHGECDNASALKLSNLGYQPMISYDDGRYMTDYAKERPDELFYFDNTYNGNLDLLHELLLKCLLEFDRICKKHDIKYFLGGGTLLGAIRHGGMIPWDDDMDVMMLREDYDKFLQVVGDEICDDMFFQSSETDNEYHSIFTKIRLNGTAFVTQYSQQFENMHQGIFIDIFVHDHTSDSKLGQKLHVFKTLFARSMVFHKWANTPMHFYGKLKLVCKLATRYINKTSMQKLEAIQDKVVRKYNSKNTKYLYDGTGEHLRHGAFPAKWLDEVEYADFSGHKLPVPKFADEYLKYSYGNYMELIPASLRKAGHDIVKVDFGKYKNFDKQES